MMLMSADVTGFGELYHPSDQCMIPCVLILLYFPFRVDLAGLCSDEYLPIDPLSSYSHAVYAQR